MKDRDFLICMHNNHLKDISNENRRRLNLITNNIPEDQEMPVAPPPSIQIMIKELSLKDARVRTDAIILILQEIQNALEAINNRMDANGLFKVMSSAEREAARQCGMTNSV